MYIYICIQIFIYLGVCVDKYFSCRIACVLPDPFLSKSKRPEDRLALERVSMYLISFIGTFIPN